MSKTQYNTVSIEAAESGWIVKERGQPTKLFYRWESLVKYLEGRLTTPGFPNL